MFLGCLSVRVCFRAYVHVSVRALILFAGYLTDQWMKFHTFLVHDVVEGIDALFRFLKIERSSSRSQQGLIFKLIIAAGGSIHIELGRQSVIWIF